eukprot:3941164-Rhodomonas_salina.1
MFGTCSKISTPSSSIRKKPDMPLEKTTRREREALAVAALTWRYPTTSHGLSVSSTAPAGGGPSRCSSSSTLPQLQPPSPSYIILKTFPNSLLQRFRPSGLNKELWNAAEYGFNNDGLLAAPSSPLACRRHWTATAQQERERECVCVCAWEGGSRGSELCSVWRAGVNLNGEWTALGTGRWTWLAQ